MINSISFVINSGHMTCLGEYIYIYIKMVFNATFNNISVISRFGQFYWYRKPEYPEKTTNLSQFKDKLFT